MIRPARMWSVLPTEPPPQETDRGSALSLATRSSSDWIGEFAGTTTISYSHGRAGKRRDLVQRDGRLVGDDGALERLTGDQDGVALALLGGHELGEADGAAGT